MLKVQRAKKSDGSVGHVAIVGPPQVRMPLAPLLVQVAAHNHRMQPPAQPRLVARLPLAAGLELFRELTGVRAARGEILPAYLKVSAEFEFKSLKVVKSTVFPRINLNR